VGELESHGEQRWERGSAEPHSRARWGHGCDAKDECQESTGKRGDVKTRASRADGKLTAADLEGSFGALMADETARAVNNEGGARDRRDRRGDGDWREHHRRDPQEQAENEKAGERQRWPPPEE